MITHKIIVRFCIFSLLKYDRIFGKNLEYEYLWGKMKSFTQHFAGVLFQTWFLKFMLVFMKHSFSSRMIVA